jgi:acetoin utilization protein AcuB
MGRIPCPAPRRNEMLVKDWMNKQVITVDPQASMHEAKKEMERNALHMLPVVKKGKLVGVVTDGEVNRASASEATSLATYELNFLLSNIRVRNIMTSNPSTVRLDHTLEEAAARLPMDCVSAVPVVDDEERVVGTISEREIFLALTSLSGYGKHGLQLAFEIEDRPGSIKEMTDVIRDFGGRLASILTSPARAPQGYRHLYVRAYNIDRGRITALVDDLRQKAILLYMVDHRENKRREAV